MLGPWVLFEELILCLQRLLEVIVMHDFARPGFVFELAVGVDKRKEGILVFCVQRMLCWPDQADLPDPKFSCRIVWLHAEGDAFDTRRNDSMMVI